jgi:hypothetical protein
MSKMLKKILLVSIVVLTGMGIVVPLVAATSPSPSVDIYGSAVVVADSTTTDGGDEGDPVIPVPPIPPPTQN